MDWRSESGNKGHRKSHDEGLIALKAEEAHLRDLTAEEITALIQEARKILARSSK
jgi:hypothetical protein